ncbi:MAG: hypothetical protein Q4D79_06135 [Propionibacteriaceae bacterium]|nr:hypothetical protein [Propionibacteriaceae bacterium]
MERQKRLYAIIDAPPTASDLFRGCLCLVLGIVLGIAHARLGVLSIPELSTSTSNASAVLVAPVAVVIPPIATALGWGTVLGPAALGCGALAAALFMTPLLGWSEPAWLLGGACFGISGAVLRRQKLAGDRHENPAAPLDWKVAGSSILVGIVGGFILAVMVAPGLLAQGRNTRSPDDLHFEQLDIALFLGPGLALLAALALFCATFIHRLGGYALAVTYWAGAAFLVRENADKINPMGFFPLTIGLIAATAALHAENADDPPVKRIDIQST